MFQFLHAADLHLDTQPAGMHGYPPDIADLLRDSSLAAFERLVNAAIERRVAFCVFSGDIYDGADRGTRAELAFRRGLQRLADHDIRSFIAHGNHDPVETGWSTIREFPEATTVFEPGSPQTITFDVDGTMVAVHGVSFGERATTDNLAVKFRRDDRATVNIGVLHTNVGGRPGHDAYAPCSLDDLLAVGLDYWALGHIHSREVLTAEQPWVVYPGNLQGRHPKPSERGPKGAMLVTVTDDRIAPPEFVELDALRFVAAEVSIDDLTDVADVFDACVRVADDLAAAHPLVPLVIRAGLHGAGPMHQLAADTSTRNELLDSLRDDGLARSPKLWWDRLVDDTVPPLDIDRLAAQDDFTGTALQWFGSPAALDDNASLTDDLPDLSRLGVEIAQPTGPDVIERSRMLAARMLTGEATS